MMAAAWLALIIYASLFPFEGWRWPPGARLADLLVLPWPRWWDPFDVGANLVGYLPLGLLWGLTLRRAGWGAWPAGLGAAAGGAAVSLALEWTQQLLPQRVPSLADWVLNSGGVASGAVLSGLVHRMGLPSRWHRLHSRWLAQGGAGIAVLLLLWPVALLVPAPVPLGLGQVGGRLREWALAAVADVPWAAPAIDWLRPAPLALSLSSAAEHLLIMLGLLAPVLVAYAASGPSWRRALLALGAPIVATLATTLSTALNFGPEHALAWRVGGLPKAWIGGTAVALALAWISPRAAAALALMALTGLVVLVHMAPPDPYYAQTLLAWEQGRFIRFHGLIRWLSWLWPYAAMAWLLAPRPAPRTGWRS